MTKEAAATLFFLLCAAGSAGAQSLRWPLNEPRKLSSSFGEYRDGHYHAGVDLRTFGRVDLPAIAPGACEVARVRVSPIGYGKAVYVRLMDGSTAVYAHLNGFSRELDSLAYHWRLERGKNSCDIEVDPGLVRFAAGETVAYTGSTGSPFPHLHFETRDSAGRPFNPLVSLYEVPDACAPVISGLEVVPVSWGSLVNGAPVPFTGRFHLVRDAHFVLGDTLQLDGAFGFGVSAYDRQAQGSYRMGPYLVELLIDGQTAYRLRNRTFDYGQFDDISLEYEDRGGKAPGRYLVLFKKAGNTMPEREGSGIVSMDAARAGALALSAGLHAGEIVVRDVAGNEARGVFHFVLHRYPVADLSVEDAPGGPRIEVSSYDPDGGIVSTVLDASLDGGMTWSTVALDRSSAVLSGRSPFRGALFRCVVRDDEGARIERIFASPDRRPEPDSVLCDVRPELRTEGLYLRIKTDRALASVPAVRRIGDPMGDLQGVFQAGAREFIAFVPIERLAGGVDLFSVRGFDYRGFPLDFIRAFQIFTFETGEGAAFDTADSLVVRLRAPSVRGRSALLVRDASGPGKAPSELEPVSAPFVLDFPVEGFARPLQVSFDSGRAAGLFRWDGRAGWRCIGVPEREGGSVEVGRSGTFAVFADSKAPVMKRLGFSRRGSGSGFFKRKLYYVPVHERGSGVDAESAAAFLNGKRAVCEYDVFRARLTIPIPRTYPAGPAKLRVELSDRAGNRSAEEFSFVIE
jgi:hypothetical protein